ETRKRPRSKRWASMQRSVPCRRRLRSLLALEVQAAGRRPPEARRRSGRLSPPVGTSVVRHSFGSADQVSDRHSYRVGPLYVASALWTFAWSIVFGTAPATRSTIRP